MATDILQKKIGVGSIYDHDFLKVQVQFSDLTELEGCFSELNNEIFETLFSKEPSKYNLFWRCALFPNAEQLQQGYDALQKGVSLVEEAIASDLLLNGRYELSMGNVLFNCQGRYFRDALDSDKVMTQSFFSLNLDLGTGQQSTSMILERPLNYFHQYQTLLSKMDYQNPDPKYYARPRQELNIEGQGFADSDELGKLINLFIFDNLNN